MSAAAAVPLPARRSTGGRKPAASAGPATRHSAHHFNREIHSATGFDPETHFPADHWFGIPNAMLRLYRDRLVTGIEQYLALEYIARCTFGSLLKLPFVGLSAAQLEAEIGGKGPRPGEGFGTRSVYQRELEDALARGLIEGRKFGLPLYSHGIKPEGWDAKIGVRIDYRLDPEFWPHATKIAIPEAAEPEAAEPEAADPEAAEPEAAVVCAPQRTVAAGAFSSLSLSVKCAEASGGSVRLRHTYQNVGSIPVTMEASTKRGCVHFTFAAVINSTQNLPTIGEHVSSQVVANKQNDKRAAAPLASSPGPSYDAIGALLREHFQQPRDTPFEARVLNALDGAPVEQLAQHAAREIPAMREKRKAVVSGILLYFAEQVGAAWRESAAETAAYDPTEYEAQKTRIKNFRKTGKL